jgi:hypothetical protein
MLVIVMPPVRLFGSAEEALRLFNASCGSVVSALPGPPQFSS